jgi:polyketide biosynthesis enoyl-CoA hydratase PksH
MPYRTINVRAEGSLCFLQFHRPEARNTINREMVEECLDVVALCERDMTALVLEGLPDVFCFGADFQGMRDQARRNSLDEHRPEVLYGLWASLASSSFVSVSHVRGKANAGGIGFVAASDIVLSAEAAEYSLSDMLFGIVPACVLPFLIRRVGFQRAHYMSLTTQPIAAPQAFNWGLVDAFAEDSEDLLRRHLLRLRRLSKTGVARYKQYVNRLCPLSNQIGQMAAAESRAVFSDDEVVRNIYRFVETGKFPWNA